MRYFNLLLLTLLVALSTTFSFAKKHKKDKPAQVVTIMTDSTAKTTTTTVVIGKDTTAKKSDKDKAKTIKEVTEKCKKFSGLFNVYQDSTSGKSYLEISEDKIGKEYIYFAYVLDGVLDAGYARGGYKDNSIFKIVKYFDRIDFVLQNTNFYFDKNNDLSKAENANINEPLFLSEKIVATSNDKGKVYLIEADNLFLGENFTQVKPTKQPG